MNKNFIFLALGILLFLGCKPDKKKDPKIEMVFVSGGKFWMGAQSENPSLHNYDTAALEDESPIRHISLLDFYIGKYEVTQKQWQIVMDENPSHFKGCDNCPVENVTKKDVDEFLKRLNKITKKKYRLPTEAEWEYVARGGKEKKAHFYSGSSVIDDVAWYSQNAEEKTHPVGKKKPNALGVYDMSGNVWEYCSDYYAAYDDNNELINPSGPKTGTYHVMRGGSWANYDFRCRVSFRTDNGPTGRKGDKGFRIALSIED